MKKALFIGTGWGLLLLVEPFTSLSLAHMYTHPGFNLFLTFCAWGLIKIK